MCSESDHLIEIDSGPTDHLFLAGVAQQSTDNGHRLHPRSMRLQQLGPPFLGGRRPARHHNGQLGPHTHRRRARPPTPPLASPGCLHPRDFMCNTDGGFLLSSEHQQSHIHFGTQGTLKQAKVLFGLSRTIWPQCAHATRRRGWDRGQGS